MPYQSEAQALRSIACSGPEAAPDCWRRKIRGKK